MQLRKAERKQAKLRIGFSGPSGSGKTFSALRVASGIAPWEKIAVIDTENGSAELYSDMGDYNVITLSAPYHPKRYIEAIETCEKAGIEIIIIDSATHEWNGKGGCLEIHEQLTEASSSKNSYTSWAKVSPLHQAFIDKILQSKCHIFTTTRRKQDYAMEEGNNGKKSIVKKGMKEEQREGFEYELTLAFDIEINHFASVSKDRTELFDGLPPFKLSKETGEKIKEWNLSGKKAVKIEIKKEEIKDSANEKTIEKLKLKVKDLDELNKRTGNKFESWDYISQKEAMSCIIALMK